MTTEVSNPAVQGTPPAASTASVDKAPSFTRGLGLETGVMVRGTIGTEIPRTGAEPPMTQAAQVLAAEEAKKAEAQQKAAAEAAPQASAEDAAKAEAKADAEGAAEAPAEGEVKEGAEEKAEAAAPKLDISSYQKEFDETGKLSDASYKAITGATGFDKATIDSIASAMKAQQTALTAKWDDMMGGPDQKKTITEWAGQNWSAEKKAAYNKIIDSNDVNAIEIAVQGMVTDYKAAGGSFEPSATVTNKEANFGEAATGYASEADYRKDVRSQQYKVDPAFRRSVQAKLSASAWHKG